MDSELVINLESMPEWGEDIEGEVDGKIFDLPEHDAQPAGPMHYRLNVQRFGEELLLQGRLTAPFAAVCTGCLVDYEFEIELENIAVSVEIESGLVNVTEALREEVLINFPAHPRCTDSREFDDCKIDLRYLAVDKPAETDLNRAPAPTGDNKWAALDALQTDLSEDSPNQ